MGTNSSNNKKLIRFEKKECSYEEKEGSNKNIE